MENEFLHLPTPPANHIRVAGSDRISFRRVEANKSIYYRSKLKEFNFEIDVNCELYGKNIEVRILGNRCVVEISIKCIRVCIIFIASLTKLNIVNHVIPSIYISIR